MTSLPDLILPLMADPRAEPWVRFCAQCLERDRSCVLVTVLEATPGGPCSPGEHFVYDGDGHGLLPLDRAFSVTLHRLTQEALQKGSMHEVAIPLPHGEVMMSLTAFKGDGIGSACSHGSGQRS